MRRDMIMMPVLCVRQRTGANLDCLPACSLASRAAGAGNHHNHNRDGRKGPCSVAARMRRLMSIIQARVKPQDTAGG